jgi:hypothetical protein
MRDPARRHELGRWMQIWVNPWTREEKPPMIRLPCTCQSNRIRSLDAIGAFKLPDHSLSMAIPDVATFSHGKTRLPGVFTPDGTSLRQA